MATIVDADTSVFVPNTHIFNRTQNLVAVSDQFGHFTLTANVGDSILISSMGYANLTMAVHDSLYNNNAVIKLQSSTYLLSELDIVLFSNYDRFRNEFLSLQAQEALRLDHVRRYNWVQPTNQAGINIPITGPLASPISYLYYMLSREGKQLQHYYSVINGTNEYIVIGEKFNGLIIRHLTGFENDELIRFATFCGFTKGFLLTASESEVQRAILRKYREYIQTLDN